MSAKKITRPKLFRKLYWLTSFLFLTSNSVVAQVIPDVTLPNNSSTTTDGNTSTITGGTQAGGNLFHSFEQFSVPTGNTAYFNNALDIHNIFSRVTGSSISNIDGLIRANGTANLFFINPNGIVFGSSARLDIGGSFVGSTANFIHFTDGFEFNALNPQPTPLLTVSVPIGLGFGSKPSSIELQGTGHSVVDSPFSFFRGRDPSNSFRVQPGRTLALIGGDLILSGGILTAEGGQIELFSIDRGLVNFTPSLSGWNFSYQEVSSFRNIDLNSKALVDASGFDDGSIQIQGANVSLADGSLLLIQNQGSQSSGSLKVKAAESLEIKGVAADLLTRSGIYSETIGNGRGADIIVSTPKLIIKDASISTSNYSSASGGDINLAAQKITITDGGLIGSSTSVTGKGGNIDVNASETIQVRKTSPISPDAFSAIVSNVRGSGNGGDVYLSTPQLVVEDRGLIGTNVLKGTGKGGNVTFNISDSIRIVGGEGFPTTSTLASTTLGRGAAGNLILNTSKLLIQDGGAVTASTFGSGNAGSLQINASDFVELREGNISSSAVLPAPQIQQFLELPVELSGISGSLTINTPTLKIQDGAQVNVSNDGSGNSGILNIDADFIALSNGGSITATTASGEGGNIFLNSQNLQLRNGSSISATAGLAGGGGNGGNITIDTDTLAVLNGSITANAFTGRGGNIEITAQGLFTTPDSQISASSVLGVDGLVRINIPELDFTKVSQPEQRPQNPQVAVVCQGQAGVASGELIDTGTGGTPASPSNPLDSSSGWHDLNSYSQEVEQLASSKPTSIVEAQGWKHNDNGTVSFTTETDDIVPYGSLSSPACIRTQSR
ncbi:MAG: hypothetical protein CLLPBCKN_007238 [Chroococcidiopsis cubana SAG 39.79]|uniref:Filamentous haemagglutinin FhaB/tRNA nuclease CdiA-like TPS domain-containing protein n=1 Tax=Chroococcidiopsis cubana SAG 39.79 TaxID=388085 RepID=A0AB37URK0_9CYAN|nr:filamentous hemagglutinin N-terminal domain-containing protein [Chroococcidiopsis cubana]MDZ4877803.1 hypothetical protein [Chroococcidiopsis cubana SAG 39.79]PSB54466.1 filamentous hemagglutinin [Chroococcidiopsis cubana CCALA 043]RUT14080.1 hypothetical protein DSM107010_05630 [Chroococcidiopsis cubana SAG 39.79]